MPRLRDPAAPRRTGPDRAVVALALLALVVVTTTAAFSAPLRRLAAPASPQTRPATASDVLASLPLSFEPAGREGFVARGPGYTLALRPSEAVVAVAGGSFRIRPAGPLANPAPVLAGQQALPGTVNHLEGETPAAWSAGVPTYGRVVADSVWPGIDMVWHGNQRRLEHDLIVGPGADPGTVALAVEGAAPLAVDAGGDLTLDLGGTSARLARPVVYQDVAGSRRAIPGRFTLLGPSTIGFDVGEYDHGLPLVIDPVLVTSTTLGGNGTDVGYSVAVDATGNIYVTGSTESADFPTATPLQAALSPAASGPSTDVFVSKLSADGATLLWSTYLGGKGRDIGYAVAVGATGSVYVSGVTESSDFPKVKGAQENYGGGPSDAFVARLAANGTALEWSTFVGGSQTDRARGLALDQAGNAYVTGSTSSVDFPAVNPQQPGPYRPDDVDAFLVKVPAAGGPLVYATRLGGSNDDHGLAVAVDTAGDAFVTGDTLSPGFPTVRPLQSASGGSASGVAGSFPDAFVAKFAPSGSALVYSTFLGGSDYDQGTSIAVDAAGAAYVTGSTNSPNFPTAAPLQPRKDGDADAFATKIDPAGGSLVYSTYLGGSGADGGNGIAVDGTGAAFLTGTTGSTNWSTTKPTQSTKSGGDDAFVLKLNPSGAGVLFSTYLGGRESDSGMSVAVDAQGAAHVLGLTSSTDFPQVKPLPSSRQPAGGEAFLATLSVADATTPAPRAGGAPSPILPSSDNGHSRRVRALAFLTFGLLLAAGLQTLYLRRREATAAPPPAPDPRPARLPMATAAPGLRVLDDPGGGTVPAKGAAGGGAAAAAAGAGAAAKAGAAKAGAAKGNRSPKARGGPKGGTGPSKSSSGAAKQGAKPKTPPRPTPAAKLPPVVEPEPKAAGTAPDPVADGGEPTVMTPAAMPPPAKPRPQEPGIAHLLEEDLWPPMAAAARPIGDVAPLPPLADEPAQVPLADATPPAPTPDDVPASAAPAGDAAAAAVPVDAAPPPAADVAASAVAPPPPPLPPPPVVPPVPAEELSFWDLFPEDLPPVRPAAYPADDLLVDHLALPDGPDSIVGRLASPPAPARAEPSAPAEPAASAAPAAPAAPVVPTAPPPAPSPALPTAPRPGPAAPGGPTPGAGGPTASTAPTAPTDPPMRAELDPLAPPARTPHPAEAEIVIAELLEGPPPPGVRQSAQSEWAPAPPGEDFLISDLLADEPAPAEPGSNGEQARIAAEQARRRRSRRGGRRNRPGSG